MRFNFYQKVKALVLVQILLTVFALSANAQALTGTKTVDPLGSGPNNYLTLKSAIDSLNTYGVGAGGVTINIVAGHTETAPVGGYVLGSSVLNPSLGSTKNLVIQKSPLTVGANPLFTAFVGTNTATDGIFILAGVDYVTIDGINLVDTNTKAPGSMESGFALVNFSGTAPFDGCQHNTIKNCSVTLSKVASNVSIGIFAGHQTATSNAALTLTSVGDLHSNNKIYSNTVTKAAIGIYFAGFAATFPFTLYDQNNDIGGSSYSTGNTVTNIGAVTGFNCFGIALINNNNGNASYNTVNNALGGSGNATQNMGVFASGTNANFTANYNKVTVTQASSTSLVGGVYASNTGNVTIVGDTVTTVRVAGANGTNYAVYSASTTTAVLNSNHVVSNTTGAVTGTSAHIYQVGLATNSVTINNNTFGPSVINTTSSHYLIYNSNGTNNSTITNNATTGLINKTGVGGSMFGYFNTSTSAVGGTTTISNNNFSNLTVTGATGLIGINQNTVLAQKAIISNNTLTNYVGGSSSINGIFFNIGDAGSKISGNTISNYSGTASNYGINIGTTAGVSLEINNNDISGITSSGGSTVAYGIFSAAGYDTKIFKNKIYGLTGNNASASAYGIAVSGGTANAVNSIYNNIITDLKAPITSSATDAVRGISITSTSVNTKINVYYNTIFLTGTSSGTNFGGSGVFHTLSATAANGALDLRNNIIVNNITSKGTGFASAFRRSGSTSLVNIAATTNNNLLYAGTPSGRSMIFYDGTNKDSTLALYKIRMGGRDANAVTENVTFTNSTTTPYDLTINTTTPTLVESGADVISTVADDYAGTTRNTTTPDIGAYEGTYTPASTDVVAPTVSYALLGKTSQLTNRSFTANISDLSGVNTTTNKPRVYYRKRSNTNNTYNDNTAGTPGWKYAEASNTSSPFNFTIDYSLLNPPLLAGDTIQYFVVAQDNATTPNVNTSGGTFATAPTSVALSAANFPLTGNIREYRVLSPIAATVTVGTGGTYPSLTGTGGLFAAINDGIMTQNVRAEILSNTTESAANELLEFTEEGAGGYRLTIAPAAATVDSIKGNFAGALIRLNQADRVTIDGSFAGSGRYLVFSNSNTGTTSIIQLNDNGTLNGCNNVIIQNNVIIGAASGTIYGIGVGNGPGTSGRNHDNVSILNNEIKAVTQGIHALSAGFPNSYDNLRIIGNEIGGAEPTLYVRLMGINVAFLSSSKINSNKIFNIITSSNNPTGITVGAGVINTNVIGNTIHTIRFTGTGGYAAKGITVSSAYPNANDTIANNMISYLLGDGWNSLSGDGGVGIRVLGTGSNYHIYNNTINLFGTPSRASETHWAGMYFASTVTGLNIVNNVISNSITNPNTGGSHRSWGISINGVPSQQITRLDNNLYNINAGVNGFIGQVGTTNHSTLDPAWKGATLSDSNSFTENVLFTDSINLHIAASGAPTLLESKGRTIAGLNYDFDGNQRPGPVGSVNGGALGYDIGADEFDGIPNLGDLTLPVFTLDSIRPLPNTCLTTGHTFYATATDASGIDSVAIFWSLGKSAAAQPVILMTNTTGNKYQGTIPANIDSLIAYSFRVVDLSVNKNALNVAGGTYKDKTFTVTASVDQDTISLGSTVQLQVTSPNEAQLGTGTGVNAAFSNIASPYATYYGNGRQQYLIRASELQTLGFSAGTINSIGFEVVAPIPTGANRTAKGFTMKLSNYIPSTITTLVNPASPTQVFGPVDYLPVLGVNQHEFTTPFIWDGTSNVLVDICFSNGVTGSSTDQWFVRQSPAGFNAHTYYQVDGAVSNICSYNATVSATPSIRPNLYINGAAAVSGATWSQTTGGGLSATNVVNPTATPTSSGTITYSVNATNGTCSANGSVDVFVVIPVTPVTAFTADTTNATLGGKVSTVIFTDQSLNLPTNWTWTFTPSTVTYVNGTNANSKNPQVQFNAAGLYTVKLKTSNVAGVDSLIKTNYINAYLGYCDAKSTQSPSVDDNIGMVMMISGNDTIFSNGSDLPITSNPLSKNNYTNFVDSTIVPTIEVEQNKKYSIDVASIHDGTRYGTGVSVYIDYNKNGSFADPGEGFFAGTIGTSGSNHLRYQFNIPCTADTGVTRMRIIQVESSTGIVPSCTTFTYGEVEDYRIRIVENPIQYVYSNVEQVTGDVLKNVVNQPVVRIPVVTTGCGVKLNLTSLSINTTGTTSLADISNAKIFYTGTSKVFADTSLFGTATPTGSFTITGSKPLLTDTNYFWLTYDINSTAVIGNFIDAEVTSLTIGGTPQIPTTTAPVGNRLINVPTVYVSNSSAQQQGLVFLGSKNNPIIRARINMANTGGPAQLNSIKFALTGTTLKSDIVKVSLYKTGSSINFNALTLIDTAVSITDTITFNKNTSLFPDSNYLWLAFDISSSAVLENHLDAELLGFTIEGNSHVATSGNPSGFRKISADYCFPSYSSGTGSGDFATYVKFGAIVDANGASPSPYYTFKPYSVYNASFQRFQTDTIEFSAGTYNSNDFGAWIDYNHDGVFDNNTEKIAEVYNIAAGPFKAKVGVKIPITANLGITRLRVREADQTSTNIHPCDPYSFGETQDYEINILPAPPGDYYPPNILNVAVNPDSQCVAVSHTISATVTDTTGIASVSLLWSSGGVPQTPIAMTNVGNVYSATVPAQGKNVVSFRIEAIDNSIYANTSRSNFDVYQDEYFRVNAGMDRNISPGQTASLSAGTTKDRPFRITEFNFFNYTGGCGLSNGSQCTWPASLPTTMYDDNLEITNLTNASADLSGYQFVTEGTSTGSITFPAGTIVPPNGVVIVHFSSAGAADPANLIFKLTAGNFAPGSGSSLGFVLKNNVGDIVDAVATNTYVFGTANGVTSDHWSGAGVTSPSGQAGATLQGDDLNDNSNWVTASLNTPVSIGFVNPSLPTLPSGSVITWTGGLLTGPQVGGSIVTPVHPNVGSFTYYAASTDGVCSYTDTVVVNVLPAPVVSLGGPTGVICGTTPRTLDAGNPGCSYLWTLDNIQVGTTRTINASVAGTYKVVVTNLAGASASDTIKLTAAAAFPFTMADRTLCTGGTITIDAGAHTAYLWSTGATTQTIQVNAIGTYHVTVTNASGCTATDTFEVTTVSPPAFTLGADRTVCSNGTITIDAGQPGSTYLWSTGATTQSIVVSAAGSYHVTVTNNSGCILMDTVNVTVTPAPVVSLGADVQICPGTNTVLDAGNVGATYLWSTGATTKTLTVTTAGTYHVAVTSGGCTSRDTIVVTLKAAPSVNLGPDLNICTSDTVTLDAGVGASYLWSTGATTRTIRVSTAGTYSVTVTNTEGCTGTDAVVVTNKATPNAAFTTTAQVGTSVTFQATSTVGLTYLWNFGDPNSAANTSQAQAPIHVFTGAGTYTVTLTVTSVANGCSATTTQQVIISGVGNNLAELFKLGAAPNPFVAETKINYTLPEDANSVSVEVYDMIGRKVADIVNNEYQASGNYQFNYRNEDMQTSSGVYMVRLTVDGKIAYVRIIDIAKK